MDSSSNLASVLAIIHPLDEFYGRAGLSLPPFTQIDGEAVPEPFRKLLVHNQDMTPTLEKFHGGTLHLKVMSCWQEGDDYFREVALVLDGSERPVEFGAIKIRLEAFPEKVRRQVLEERLPLGHILHENKFVHESRPAGFLRLASDPLINQALVLHGAHRLYGRRNNLLDSKGKVFAEIVEILPPQST